MLILEHVLYLERFKTDHSKPIDEDSTLLVDEIGAFIANPFMDALHHLPRLFSCRSAFRALGEFSLPFG